MPRYFLHLHNRTGPIVDEEGQELPDPAAARSEAIRNIRSILSAEVMDGMLDIRGRLEIFDDRGMLVETVPFGEAVKVVGSDG